MLIFEFKDMEAAQAFTAEAECQYPKRAFMIFDDAAEACAELLYPFPLTAPIVGVSRTKTYSGEDDIEALANAFGGEFVGT